MSDLEQRIAFIADEMQSFPEVVHIGYSGGKDSSAVVKLLLNALRRLDGVGPQIEIVYCDTGVENPIIDRFVKNTLGLLDIEFRAAGLKAASRLIRPSTQQSFFVRMIGRGYPPPTNSFRWCTKDIRIRPFQRFLRDQATQTLIAVGTRIGESAQRDRSLRKSAVSSDGYGFYQKQRDGFPGATLFTPIIDFNVDDVWRVLFELDFPKAIDINTLARLYKDGGAECPAIRDFKDKPCSRSRFGCWTCTAVRRDRSAENMIAQGHEELRPFFEFREWLTKIRNEPNYRCRFRRNGQQGPGPFTLEARAMLLDRVFSLEKTTGRELVTAEQKAEIYRLWVLDRDDANYALIR